MQELYVQLDELTEALMRELDTCKTSGCQYAENEAEYRKALRIEILTERDKRTPVTIISEAIYKASQEAINVYKLRMRMLDAQISRIWSSGGQGGAA